MKSFTRLVLQRKRTRISQPAQRHPRAPIDSDYWAPAALISLMPTEPSKNDTPRLEWASKPDTVERVTLPFQVVETINESRATREAQTGSLFGSEEPSTADGWRNKLIWGDNRLIAASLMEELAGHVALVYIDPPFDTGTDFSFRTKVGDEAVTKEPSIIEEHAYSDTWGAGRSSYLRMMYERLLMIHQLLSDQGSLYLHCASTVSHYLKVLCDEVFGSDGFRNEIIWKRTSSHNDAKRYAEIHDTILYYAKSTEAVWNSQHSEHNEDYIKSHYSRTDDLGRRYRLDNIIRSASMGARPNLAYEYEGYTPAWGWRVSKPKLEVIDAEGGLVGRRAAHRTSFDTWTKCLALQCRRSGTTFRQ